MHHKTKQNIRKLGLPEVPNIPDGMHVILTAYGENPLWFNIQNHLMINIPLLINQHGILLNQKS